MSIRNKLIIAFIFILLLAIIPLSMFTLKVAPSNTWFLENKNLEYVLDNTATTTNNPELKAKATDALHEYRQVVAIGAPLKREFIRFSIILACILSLIAIGIIFISVSRITKPLQELTGATKRIAQGDMSIQLQENRSGEFRTLIKSFNYMAHALQEAQHRLAVAERHTAWREMARMLAHEIKNPLTPIQLSIQRLREKYLAKNPDLPEIIDKTTTVVGQEVEHLLQLVNKFSDFAHLPSPVFQMGSINNIVKDVVALYTNMPDVKFETIYEETIPDMKFDPGQIKQAFSNIIKNAIEASNGTRLIKIITNLNPEGIEVSITDKGKGMTQEEIEHMFHPYFTTKKEGSGLGLVITERIITEHSGKINVESKKGEGTTVTIKLPIEK